MTRADVLTECDRLEEHGTGLAREQVTLTRLQHSAQCGNVLTEEEQTTVRTLTEYLKIQPTKIVTVVVGTKGKVEFEPFFLSQPLGPYYTKITVPHRIIHKEEVTRQWEANPIELAEVFGIVSGDNLKARLQSCPYVSLHFEISSLAKMLPVLVGLKLDECKILELRNLQIQPSHVPAIKQRMNWPKLKTILLKG